MLSFCSIIWLQVLIFCFGIQEYVVEDLDGEILGPDWMPPPLPQEHVQQLKSLGLL